jgi:hypothetical protein
MGRSPWRSPDTSGQHRSSQRVSTRSGGTGIAANPNSRTPEHHQEASPAATACASTGGDERFVGVPERRRTVNREFFGGMFMKPVDLAQGGVSNRGVLAHPWASIWDEETLAHALAPYPRGREQGRRGCGDNVGWDLTRLSAVLSGRGHVQRVRPKASTTINLPSKRSHSTAFDNEERVRERRVWAAR